MPRNSFLIEDILENGANANKMMASMNGNQYKDFLLQKKQRAVMQSMSTSSLPQAADKDFNLANSANLVFKNLLKNQQSQVNLSSVKQPKLSPSLSPASLSSTSSYSSTLSSNASSDDNNNIDVNDLKAQYLKSLPALLFNGLFNMHENSFFQHAQQHQPPVPQDFAAVLNPTNELAQTPEQILMQSFIQNMQQHQQQQQQQVQQSQFAGIDPQLLSQYYSRLLFMNAQNTMNGLGIPSPNLAAPNKNMNDYESPNPSKRIKLSNATSSPSKYNPVQHDPHHLQSSLLAKFASASALHSTFNPSGLDEHKLNHMPLPNPNENISGALAALNKLSGKSKAASSSNLANQNAKAIDRSSMSHLNQKYKGLSNEMNASGSLKRSHLAASSSTSPEIENPSSSHLSPQSNEDLSIENVSPLDALLKLANNTFVGRPDCQVAAVEDKGRANLHHDDDENLSSNELSSNDKYDSKRSSSSNNTSFDSSNGNNRSLNKSASSVVPNSSAAALMSNGIKRKRKNRTAFTANQIFELERRFANKQYLSPHDRDQIAYELSLSTAQVITWFQNRRAKQKRDLEELKNDVNAAKSLNVIDPDIDVDKVLRNDSVKYQYCLNNANSRLNRSSSSICSNSSSHFNEKLARPIDHLSSQQQHHHQQLLSQHQQRMANLMSSMFENSSSKQKEESENKPVENYENDQSDVEDANEEADEDYYNTNSTHDDNRPRAEDDNQEHSNVDVDDDEEGDYSNHSANEDKSGDSSV